MSESYDVVIVGSGPAGYTAALYAARANLDVLMFQGFEVGGQLMLTSDVENYPGYRDGVMGPDMMDDFEAQAARFGAKMRPENVERLDFSERPFKLWAEDEEEPVFARSVVIATGAKAKWLGLPGEERLKGRGVSGCATCDGFFYKEKRVAVVGGGDTAMEEALFLTKFAADVLLIHRRDHFRASKIMLERALKNPKVTFLTDTVVQDVLGEESVEGIRIKNLETGEEREIEVDGFFAAIGHAPATGIFEDQVEMDAGGYRVFARGYFPFLRHSSNSPHGRQFITLPFSTHARRAWEMPNFAKPRAVSSWASVSMVMRAPAFMASLR
ncbi:MAG: FAD-dependent oxidoreductase [Actinobacteria bacterium]|nr:FAD-dependent oxidoreductase [Actinomycetota bacterium]